MSENATPEKVKRVLDKYLTEDQGGNFYTEDLRLLVQAGTGEEPSRLTFLNWVKDRAHGIGEFKHAHGSSSSSPFGTYRGLRVRSAQVKRAGDKAWCSVRFSL